jgi:hypothetical protein
MLFKLVVPMSVYLATSHQLIPIDICIASWHVLTENVLLSHAIKIMLLFFPHNYDL